MTSSTSTRGSHGATLPYVFTYDEMLSHFLNAPSMLPSADDLETAIGRLGRNAGPSFLADLDIEGLLTAEAAAGIVPSAWSGVEWPNRALDEATWRSLFDLAGYTVDGVPAPRPAAPNDRDLAMWFARRYDSQGEEWVGRVWTVDAPPACLLARITAERPGESEHVVDTRGLRVRPCGGQV